MTALRRQKKSAPPKARSNTGHKSGVVSLAFVGSLKNTQMVDTATIKQKYLYRFRNRVADPDTPTDSLSDNGDDLIFVFPIFENHLNIFSSPIYLISRNRVAGPDTTTDSMSHNGDHLGIRLPDPKNPIKHFFITNLLHILQSGRGSGYHHRFGVELPR
jgi:hypothetical protein